MYPFNGLLLVIYATSLYFPFAVEMEGFHSAPPTDLIGFLVVVTMSCMLCMRTNYSREAFLRKDFVLENKLKYENLVTKNILTNMFPKAEHAEKLLAKKIPLEQLRNVTLLYSDIKGFTPLVQSMDPLQLCGYLDDLYTKFDSHLEKYGIYKLDTIGDAFVCVIGAGDIKDTGETDAVKMTQFAFHMLDDIEKFKKEHRLDLDMRIGIHKGDVVGGVVGKKKPRYLCWGKDCIVGNKLESDGMPGAVHISEVVKDELDMSEVQSRLGWKLESHNANMSITFQSPKHDISPKIATTREEEKKAGEVRSPEEAGKSWSAEWKKDEHIETFIVSRDTRVISTAKSTRDRRRSGSADASSRGRRSSRASINYGGSDAGSSIGRDSDAGSRISRNSSNCSVSGSQKVLAQVFAPMALLTVPVVTEETPAQLLSTRTNKNVKSGRSGGEGGWN